MIKVGVIGTGEMGQHHVRVYSEMEDVQLVGIADMNEERVKKLAKKYDATAYTDYKDLLDLDIDAVSIVVPTKLHKEIALDAIDSGINTLIEKPIADTIESANAIMEKSKDVKLMIGHIERFNPAIIALKENMERGVIGRAVSISATRVGPYNPRIRDVGIILDLGVHDIDVMSYLYSKKVKSVHAYAGSVIHRFEDYASILLGFGNGTAGSIETNWLTPHKIRQLTITGTHGIAYVDYIHQSLKLCNEKQIIDVPIKKKEPLKNELEHFIGCIGANKSPIVSGEDGKHALKVALAAIESYKTEKAIEVL